MSRKSHLDLTPIVLAAGASSRMGRPKDLLEFRGVTCLELVLTACADAGLGEPVLVTRKSRAAEMTGFLAARPHLRARLAVNPTPELGQTSSLRAGLAALAATATGFFIYPVDHPLVTADDLAALAAAFVAHNPPPPGPPTTLIVAPSFAGRRGHPVLVHASLAPAIRALPEDGSARDVLAQHAQHTFYVGFDDDRAQCDMDTPAAYEACLARYLARTPTAG